MEGNVSIHYITDGVHKKEREKYLDHRYDGQAKQYQKVIEAYLKK